MTNKTLTVLQASIALSSAALVGSYATTGSWLAVVWLVTSVLSTCTLVQMARRS